MEKRDYENLLTNILNQAKGYISRYFSQINEYFNEIKGHYLKTNEDLAKIKEEIVKLRGTIEIRERNQGYEAGYRAGMKSAADDIFDEIETKREDGFGLPGLAFYDRSKKKYKGEASVSKSRDELLNKEAVWRQKYIFKEFENGAGI